MWKLIGSLVVGPSRRQPGRKRLRRVVRRRRVRKPHRPLTAAETLQRGLARPLILERVAYWSGVMDITPGRVAVRNQRSRWGSASSLGNLNFNWRIAGLPESVRDYVIIHELAHLCQMNHSPAFWAIVAEYCPAYKKHRKWLREHSKATQLA